MATGLADDDCMPLFNLRDQGGKATFGLRNIGDLHDLITSNFDLVWSGLIVKCRCQCMQTCGKGLWMVQETRLETRANTWFRAYFAVEGQLFWRARSGS